MTNSLRQSDDSSFIAALNESCGSLFSLAAFAGEQKGRPIFPCKIFLRQIYSESSAAEGFLDSCGARRNSAWFRLRELAAAIKLFSYVCYNVEHIKKAASEYKLLTIEDDFPGDTDKILFQLKDSIFKVCSAILSEAIARGPIAKIKKTDISCEEAVPQIHLKADKKLKIIENPEKTAIYIANKVLNYSEDSGALELLKERNKLNYKTRIANSVSEENARIAEAGFHNLQAVYDTYISETDLESGDRSLPILRGHISMIYHLLESATAICHFYERHIMRPYQAAEFPFSGDLLLEILYAFFLHYANQYLTSAKELCRNIIRSYSSTEEIEVEIPRYRGFHVRPSALIAKIAIHYGSPLSMLMNDTEYDASQALELFRANEEINAGKRRIIGEELASYKYFSYAPDSPQKKPLLASMLYDLIRNKTLVLYDHDIDFNVVAGSEDNTVGETLLTLIKHYMAVGKLDINAPIKVKFRGDSRAIDDLKILAENGYGEDNYGNNIMLPPELSYLR